MEMSVNQTKSSLPAVKHIFTYIPLNVSVIYTTAAVCGKAVNLCLANF